MRIRICLKSFLSVLDLRSHVDDFWNTLSRVDISESSAFQISFGRVKTELFEEIDVIASICQPSKHAVGSLGITWWHFVYLFSFIEFCL